MNVVSNSEVRCPLGLSNREREMGVDPAAGLVDLGLDVSWVPPEEQCLIPFNPPLPLLRGPWPSSSSSSSFVLAFRDEQAWRRALLATEAQLREQCEAGARIGCSISASKKCKPPWWRYLFRLLGSKPTDFEARAQCEEQEMEACIASSREACLQFAKKKCLPSFQDARIAFANRNQGSQCANCSGLKLLDSK